MGNVVMFPAHKARKPKTNSASKQTNEQAKLIKENIFIDNLGNRRNKYYNNRCFV